MQCHSPTYDHRIRHDESWQKKKCNVTHILLVMEWDMMSLPGKSENSGHSPPVGHGDYFLAQQKMQCHSHAVDQARMSHFTKEYSITHILLVMAWDCLQRKQGRVTHILFVLGWDKTTKSHETVWQKMQYHNVTHILLILLVMRWVRHDETVPRKEMLLTCWWFWNETWWDRKQMHYHSQTSMVHGTRSDETPFAENMWCYYSHPGCD